MKCPKIVSPPIKIAENIFILHREQLFTCSNQGTAFLSQVGRVFTKSVLKPMIWGNPRMHKRPPILPHRLYLSVML